jgi:hypothetical protein
MSKQGLTLGIRYIMQVYWKKHVNSNFSLHKFSCTPNQKMKKGADTMYHEDLPHQKPYSINKTFN